MIKLGDRITVKPATFDVPGKDGKLKGVPGTVVYISILPGDIASSSLT